MKLIINDISTIALFQQKFNAEMPFLKIEFFKKMHKPGEGLPRHVMYGNDKKLGEIRDLHNEGSIDVNPDMKVSELENILNKKYGLHAQVFRKSGNVWLATTSTDSWTLRQQNNEGESLQQHYKPEHDEHDYHEQE